MSTALYRRYRPDTFTDVIGQEHVTGPLATALGKDAVSHAYLFSGPRGCGKTTSARILARCLNCEHGPTGSPCEQCASCRDLATGGSGSLDVIEIDAASHGGVDDARDLRERATFAPVRDRYKIFIIDEAHMVTAAGFNALLKIVEEPPEHIKFIFATTEPDKVIGTIRSRTHHYPFRLVPPEPLLDYLERLCGAENVQVAPGVLQLVLRAGGGSVRDTLSVLDQLIAGAGSDGLDYDRAVALLGFTHTALLDQVVDAVAALDGATAFQVVDRVVQSGQDPRRFVEDLLERLRDLIIVKSVPESPQAILRGVPEDQIRVMQNQAGTIGAAELSRAADITATALTEMVGATSPRLHLELLMARLLLPHAESGHASIAARLERLERRLDFTSGAGTTPAGEAPRGSQAQQAPTAPAEPAAPQESSGTGAQEHWSAPGVSSPRPAEQQPPATSDADSATNPRGPRSQQTAHPEPSPTVPPARTATPPAGGGQTERMQQAWPDVVEAMKSRSRMLWMLVKGNVQVTGFDGQTLTLSFSNEGAHATFTNRGGDKALADSIQEVVGIQVRFHLIGQDGQPQQPAAPPGGGPPPKAEGRAEASAPAQPRSTSAAQPSTAGTPQHSPESLSIPTPPDDGWVPPTEEPPDLPPPDLPPGPRHDEAPGPSPRSEQDTPAEHRTGPQSPPEAARRVPDKPVVPAFARRAGGSPQTGSAPAGDPAPARGSAPSPFNGAGAAIRNRLASRGAAAPWDTSTSPAQSTDQEYDASPPPDWAEAQPPTAESDDVASEDDADLEHSGVFGRKAIERILDGVLIEEHRLDAPSP
ncbi:DNA polymerase III subunit gamma and tau [Nesterenkonia muleiensis]|uniref:DNA polymerase III subunit gamma and tau n=1 Tax=Nesterenkonia muleiensis TaxID=2282648 RepID=UPI001EE479D6|nr:DNA polymerase III subunit gamma and tau [Nesterenkonia muleiensis]